MNIKLPNNMESGLGSAGKEIEPDHYEETISSKLSHYQPRRIQRYASANVLLLTWKDDDIGVEGEVNQLGDMFKTTFNYSIWPFKIPSERPGFKLADFILKAVSSFGGEDGLLIVYYGGHGGPAVQNKSPCTWAAYVAS